MLASLPDIRISFDLDQHLGINEAPDLEHRRRRQNVPEELAMGSCNGLPVVGDVNDIGAGAYDVFEVCACS